jgi:para-nitrobenzyl esterase
VSAPHIVEIDSGLIEGVASDGGRSRVFKGIPFASPPVGALRWREPQPVEPWSGVRPAKQYGCAPVQPAMADDSLMRQFSFATPPECGIAEDCLYLNVWTEADTTDSKRPVIVWIYGGGHRVGSGSHPVADGTRLAELGAVVVSINYRLGALGYLAHPELTRASGAWGASGNYAGLDLVAALQWIQRNIAAFGGDPSCVTLFGQSAGAAHVNVLAASPMARGLFHRVVVHSSGRFAGGPMGAPMKTLAEAERDGERLLSSLGAHTLDDLRSMPADSMPGPRGFWNPIVDGRLLRDSVQTVFERGEETRVPVLAGYTANEAAPYPQADLHTRESFVRYAEQTYGNMAGAFLRLYPHETDLDAARSSYLLRRDTAFAYQPYKYARFASNGEMDTWLFNFTREVPLPGELQFHEPAPPQGYGAYHGAELWYVFNTLRNQPWQWTADDERLAQHMARYWLEFARSGNPNVDGLPEWRPFGAAAPHAMHLGTRIALDVPINLAALEFHDAWFCAERERASGFAPLLSN